MRFDATHTLVINGQEITEGTDIYSDRSGDGYTYKGISRVPGDGTGTTGKVIVTDDAMSGEREYYPSVFGGTIVPRKASDPRVRFPYAPGNEFSPWPHNGGEYTSDLPSIIAAGGVIAHVETVITGIPGLTDDAPGAYLVTNPSLPFTNPRGTGTTVPGNTFHVWHASYSEDYSAWIITHFGHYSSIAVALSAVAVAVTGDTG